MKKRLVSVSLVIAAALLAYGCASMIGTGTMLQAPRVRTASDHPAEIALNGTGQGTLRAWANVKNPNSYPITLSRVHGTLFLGHQKAGHVTLEPDLKLKAREDKVVPFDMEFDGKDASLSVPREAGSTVAYRLDGTLGVTTKDNPEPVFGPVTVVEGEARIR